MKDKKLTEIVSGKVSKTFFKFALPNIASFLAMSSASVVDALFVANYAGKLSLAAVNIIIPIFSLCFGISVMFTVGGAVRAGKYIGEGNKEAARAIFTKTIIAISLFSIIMSFVFVLFSENSARFLGANDELAPLSAEYLRIIGVFIIFFTVLYSLSVFARVDEKPFLASAALISGAIANIALDFLFIAILKMGVTGAALGTGLSVFIQIPILLPHFLMKKGGLYFTSKVGRWKEIAVAAYNGFSEFVNEISNGIVMFLFNRIMIGMLGVNGVAALTTTLYLTWLGGMINYSAADSLNPLISVNYGATRQDRIIKFLKMGLAFVLANGLVIFILMTLIPDRLVSMFLHDKTSEAYFIAMEFIFYMRFLFFFSGPVMIFSAYFTALHRPLESAFISVLKSLIMPVLLLNILPIFLGKTGVFIAVPISDMTAMACALFLFMVTKKRLLRFYTKKKELSNDTNMKTMV